VNFSRNALNYAVCSSQSPNCDSALCSLLFCFSSILLRVFDHFIILKLTQSLITSKNHIESLVHYHYIAKSHSNQSNPINKNKNSLFTQNSSTPNAYIAFMVHSNCTHIEIKLLKLLVDNEKMAVWNRECQWNTNWFLITLLQQKCSIHCNL
jgi:hypothetical protein